MKWWDQMPRSAVSLIIDCLFFSFFRLLLNVFYIFPILFSRFWIIFIIITLNSFSGELPSSSSFICCCQFLLSSFICSIFLCLFILSNLLYLRSSLVAQMVKHLSTMWETWVWSLGQEDPLEKEMGIHSSTIAWKIPWTEEPGWLQSMGSQRVRHDWETSLSFSLFFSTVYRAVILFASGISFQWVRLVQWLCRFLMGRTGACFLVVQTRSFPSHGQGNIRGCVLGVSVDL